MFYDIFLGFIQFVDKEHDTYGQAWNKKPPSLDFPSDIDPISQEPNLFGRFTNNKILVGVVLRFVFNMTLKPLIKSLNHPKTWEPIKLF